VSVLSVQGSPYSPNTRVKVTERLLIAGLRAQERADEAEAARAQLTFLFKASQRLALSLEPATIMEILLDLVVPELADAATLHGTPAAAGATQTSMALSEPIEGRSSEWWQWVERGTRPHLTRAINVGVTATGVLSPKHARALQQIGAMVSYLIVPLHARGRGLGALRMLSVEPRHQFAQDDIRLAEAFAGQASLALENARLFQEQRALVDHLEEVRGRLDVAQTDWLREDERRRVARDLHDHVEQTFFAIGLTATATLDERRGAPDPQDLVRALRRAGELASDGAEQLRSAIFALKHADYSAFGLIATLRNLVREFEQRTGVDTDLVLSGRESDIPSRLTETLHAIAREALVNVERHARASSAVVRLHIRPHSVTLTVHDDGVGAPNLALRRLGSSATHFGLAGLRERVRGLGGQFSARQGPNGGFIVRAALPLNAHGKS
jgi:signal transduction histidine kinase